MRIFLKNRRQKSLNYLPVRIQILPKPNPSNILWKTSKILWRATIWVNSITTTTTPPPSQAIIRTISAVVTGSACSAIIATLRSGPCATCAESASRRQEGSCSSMRFRILWTLVITRLLRLPTSTTKTPIWISKSRRTHTQSSLWGDTNNLKQFPSSLLFLCNTILPCLRWISMHSKPQSMFRKCSNNKLRSTSKYLRGLSNQLLYRPNLRLSSLKTSKWDKKTQSLWISN